jgi:hypothetical protein
MDGYIHHLVLPETLAQLGLLIAGVIGICVAVRTLNTIQRQALIMVQQTRVLTRQAKASEDALTQAKISSDVLANIERAWVDVWIRNSSVDSIYTLEIVNRGRTVAHIREIEIIRTLTPADNVKQKVIDRVVHRKSKLLVPGEPWPALPFNLEADPGSEMFQRIKNGETRIDYRCVVHYASISPDCTSECLYYWDAGHNYRRLVPVEAPEYNQHT